MAVAGRFKLYNRTKFYMGNGSINFATNTFKLAMFQFTSNANTLSVGTGLLADLTNQTANGNGYTTGGVTLASVTWTETGGIATFDFADPSFTASGGNIVGRYGVIYRSGTVNSITDVLVGVCLLDTAPADLTITAGSTRSIQINTSGAFNLSGATTD